MSPSFVFPSNFHDLEQDLNQEGQSLYAQFPVDVSSLPAPVLEELVKGVVFDLSDREIFCVEDQDVFDRVYSLVKGYLRLNPAARSTFVDTLRSNLSVLLPSVDVLSRNLLSSPSHSPSSSSAETVPIDRLASHQNAFKIYTFFLLHIVLIQESPAGQESASVVISKGAAQPRKRNNATKAWNWEAHRTRIMGLIANSLEINLSLIFGSSYPDQNYFSFVSKSVFSLYENQIVLRDVDMRDGLSRIVGAISTKHHQTAQSSASILHLVYKFDFTVPYMAEAVSAAERKYGDGTLAISLIREIGRTDPKDFVRDATGAENVGRFLVELADRLPKLMATNAGVLVPHFGGESYKIRNALVGVLGKLIARAFKDVDSDLCSKSMRLKGKQAMLEILIERCRDISAYTRSRVLQVWAELCEEHIVSIAHWNEVASIAAGRLEDKSAIVRKSALNLLIMMLQHNPFGPQLRVAAFEATLEKYKEELRLMEPKNISDVVPDVFVSFGEPGNDQQESVSDSLFSGGEEEADKQMTSMDVGILDQNRVLVASLEAGLRFTRCITSTLPTLVQLLASPSASDVENAIILLMRCKQFQIDGSEGCLRKMLPLVFSQDKSISEVVASAFVSIYIKKNPAETAGNLLSLAIDSNIGDLAALERLIDLLFSKGEISTATISALWDIFNFNYNSVTASQSRGALSILCMAAKYSGEVLSPHLQEIIDIGFGRWAKEEPLLARTACIALERISEEDKEKLRSSSDSRVFGFLQNLICSFWLPDDIWYNAVDKAIGLIYSIHPTPENFAADLIKKSLNAVFSCTALEDSIDCKSATSSFLLAIPVSKLSRYLFLVSHIALNQLVYMESCIRKIQKQNLRKDSSSLESVAVEENFAVKDDGINAELGLAATDDVIIDGLCEKAEKEIISSGSGEKNLIGNSAPFLAKLCRNYSLLQKFPELQASAMLALCRLMIIDAEFCAANLQLLFTVVENAPSETVRSNCTVALGDLAVRFPNLVVPWTENMYARLRDPSPSVRKNAVLVLSHLILNDMMKVKGYINEMALRLEDDDERISSLAKLFFNELSKKGNNPIYNLLPDILGKLCNDNLNEEAFCNIMQYLVNSIKKDKQMESLVEKLCNRFTGVIDTRQWKRIAYCLSQLTFTEKGIKKFMDSSKLYEHALSEVSVMHYFRIILTKGKKFAKVELKSHIEEFEEKLDKIHVDRKEQEMTFRSAEEYQKRIGDVKDVLTSCDGCVEAVDEDCVNDETGEVIDPFENEGVDKPGCLLSESRCTRSGENYSASSILAGSENESAEILSPKMSARGASKQTFKSMKNRRRGIE